MTWLFSLLTWWRQPLKRRPWTPPMGSGCHPREGRAICDLKKRAQREEAISERI